MLSFSRCHATTIEEKTKEIAVSLLINVCDRLSQTRMVIGWDKDFHENPEALDSQGRRAQPRISKPFTPQSPQTLFEVSRIIDALVIAGVCLAYRADKSLESGSPSCNRASRHVKWSKNPAQETML